MIKKSLNILILEDSDDDLEILLDHLKEEGYEVTYRREETREGMLDALEEKHWDLVLSDYSMPCFSAPEALKTLKSVDPGIPFIIVSGTVGEETAVEAMRAGAQDFFVKGKFSRLAPAIERELHDCKLRKKLRESEEMFRHSQKMEAFGRLAGGVAHDFNNILAVILMCSDSLKSQLDEIGTDFKELEQIRHAGKRAADLTRQLLAFSRKQVLDLRVLDLNEVVHRMGEMLKTLIRESIHLKLELAPQLNAIKVDPGLMEQVIMNLAVNARHAMPVGGTLVIRTQNIEVGAEHGEPSGVPPGSYVLLSTEDTGCGMDAETMARIFEPFFTTKGPHMGTGLGLSTVYGIISQSGGVIKVSSKKGEGTTFHIYLPVVNLPVEEEEKIIPQQREAGPPATILLVEDDQSLRQVICSNLERHGHQVYSLASPAEALALVREKKFSLDLIVTDVVMPEMSGTTLVAEIRTLCPRAKALYISGYVPEGENLSRTSKHEESFLLKPFSNEKLFNKIDDLLRVSF